MATDNTNEINKVFEVFYRTVNPFINFGNKTSRNAAALLIKRFGLEKTIALAKYACAVQGQKFAPTITTPYQLKEKFAQLKVFADRQKAQEERIQIL